MDTIFSPFLVLDVNLGKHVQQAGTVEYIYDTEPQPVSCPLTEPAKRADTFVVQLGNEDRGPAAGKINNPVKAAIYQNIGDSFWFNWQACPDCEERFACPFCLLNEAGRILAKQGGVDFGMIAAQFPEKGSNLY